MPDELGDFQTPPVLVERLLDLLPEHAWDRVLEPTCGVGNFMRAAGDRFAAAEVVGIEIQPGHAEAARRFGRVLEADVFRTDLAVAPDWARPDGALLVLGNPPWVTNSALATAGSTNRPTRRNDAGLRGIDAMTGGSNFDLAEYVWMKVLRELGGGPFTAAFVCKAQVARRVLAQAAAEALPIIGARLWSLDASHWFGANVGACWFVVEVGPGRPDYTADVFADLAAQSPTSRMGVVDGRLVADVDAYRRSRSLDHASPYEWRQGVKHDAAAVMELTETASGLCNGNGELVDVEAEYVFPLLKCTDVFRGRVDPIRRRLIVPQRHPGEPTARLDSEAPRLWEYLSRHADRLDARRSSIYRGRPRFSVFGVGPYTFAPYKVAVSGFHAEPVFRLIGPWSGRPVVFDDSTYLLAFDTEVEAAEVARRLLSPAVTDLIRALVFPDAKRPLTKALLRRLDISTLAAGGARVPG